MTGEKHRKTPRSIILQSLPQALRSKIGDDKLLKLCRRYDYRKRAHNVRCPNCNSIEVDYRSRTHDRKCQKCKTIIPIIKPAIGINTSSINSYPINRELIEVDYE